MNPQSKEQYAWDAFCYLAGEMTPQEQAQFEATLADNQSAREALAEAVELTQSARAALTPAPALNVPAPKQSRSETPPRRMAAGHWAWMALGAAACLLLMLGWQQAGSLFSSPNEVGTNEQSADETSPALAQRWSEVRELSIDPWNETAEGEIPALDDWADADEADDDFSPLAAPEWMLAAAQVHQDKMMTDGMMEEIERGIDPPQEQ